MLNPPSQAYFKRPKGFRTGLPTVPKPKSPSYSVVTNRPASGLVAASPIRPALRQPNVAVPFGPGRRRQRGSPLTTVNLPKPKSGIPRPVLRQPKLLSNAPRPILRQRSPGQMLNMTGTTKTKPMLKNSTRQRFDRFASRGLGRVGSYAQKRGFGSVAKGISKARSFFKPVRMSRYPGNVANFSAYQKLRNSERWGRNRGRRSGFRGWRHPSRRQIVKRIPLVAATGGALLATHLLTQ